MSWERLPDGREYLPEGTILLLSDSGSYRITGSPVGYGGSGILYPAVRIRREEGTWVTDPMKLILKECCPAVRGKVLMRDGAGRILEREDPFYTYARTQMLREKEVTGQIYNRGFRLVPLWTVSEEEQLSMDGVHFSEADNLYGVMERLDEKGISLARLQREHSLSAYQIVTLTGQLLHAIREVHESGFIHGDIQENNIFVKGFDEKETETGLVSLIDFGAARTLLEDGATAAISDRLLYTTSGYTAPECLYHNDGTLRLTPAADLYSVGILLLQMLTGRIYNEQALSLVTDGIYLYPRQARRLSCPAAALDAINRVLARVLSREPESRYQTATEMLEELNRARTILAPVKSEVAASDYTAFISYTHEPGLMETARTLQHMLEQYKIPAPLRKSPKDKHIGRIFLDRTELSSHSDMEAVLNDALDHSEFLIVLLSPSTAVSPWVAREIEHFQEHHTPDRILTVLVSGEPRETLPGPLQEQKEGLAADIRSASFSEQKKKMKTEILRLIAPMLGCGFDDLRQRQKEYEFRRRIRILGGVTAVSLVMAAVLGYAAFQIDKNYRLVQRSNALSLARESAELFAEGDRTEAIQKAVEALPESEADHSKPLLLQAKAALSDALYAYQGKQSALSLLEARQTWKMNQASTGDEMISPKQDLFLSRDRSGLYIYDTRQGQFLRYYPVSELEEKGLEGEILFAGFCENEILILLTGEGIYRLDLTTAKLQEVILFTDGRYGTGTRLYKAVLSEDGKRLAVFANPSFWWDGENRVDEDSSCLIVYDTEDGSVIWQDAQSDGLFPCFTIYTEARQILFEGDTLAVMMTDAHGKRMLTELPEQIEITEEGDGTVRGILCLVDLSEKTCQVLVSGRMGFIHGDFDRDGNLAVCSFEPDFPAVHPQGEVRCFSAGSLETLWNRELLFSLSGEDTVGAAPAKSSAGDAWFVWDNREIRLLDASDGNILWDETLSEGIVGINRTVSDSFMLGTENGGIFYCSPVISMCQKIGIRFHHQADHFMAAEDCGTVFSLDRADGRIVQLSYMADPTGKTVDLEGLLKEGEKLAQYQSSEEVPYLLMFVVDEENRHLSVVADIRTEERTGEFVMSGSDGKGGWILSRILFFALTEAKEENEEGKADSFRTVFLDAAEGDILRDEMREGTYLFLWRYKDVSYVGYYKEDTFFWDTVTEKDGKAVFKNNSISLEDLAGPGETITGGWIDSTGDALALLLQNEASEYLLRTAGTRDGKELPLPEEVRSIRSFTEISTAPGVKTDLAAVYDSKEETLHVFHLMSGEETAQIALKGLGDFFSLPHFAFAPEDDMIAALDGDGYVKVFDAETGELISRTEEQFLYISDVQWAWDGTLIVKGLSKEQSDAVMTTRYYGFDTKLPMYGLFTWIYQMDDEGKLCRMARVMDGEYSSIAGLVYTEDDTSVSVYPWHSLDELLTMAEEQQK